MSKAFQRTCMGCNKKKNKYDLIRIIKNQENEILVDKTGKLDGRGTYICNSIECLEKVIKSGRIERILKVNIDKKIYENIRGVIIDNANNEKTNQ